MSEPAEATAGQSLAWDRSVADYPPSAGWSLRYVLLGAERYTIEAAANAAGTGYEVRLGFADTAGWSAGSYAVTGYVECGPDRWPVYSGSITIRPNPLTATPALSEDEQVLAAIKARIRGDLPAGMAKLQINGRAIERYSLTELVKLQGIYERRVQAASHPRSGGRTRQAVFGW